MSANSFVGKSRVKVDVLIIPVFCFRSACVRAGA